MCCLLHVVTPYPGKDEHCNDARLHAHRTAAPVTEVVTPHNSAGVVLVLEQRLLLHNLGLSNIKIVPI